MTDLGRAPLHVAIVMDGNGRWANKRYLPRIAGHRQGVEALRRCIKACESRRISVLTVFAFSSENWGRPAEEVGGLLELMGTALVRETGPLHEAGVRMCFVGDRQSLPHRLSSSFVEAEQRTAANTKLLLNICFNYGGRWDIAQAADRLMREGVAITQESLGNAMALAHVPDPDLVIRTGGEQRISNFMLWQAAYSELFFTDCLWPEFDEAELDRALAVYATRQRRFGKTPEQSPNRT